MKKNIALSEIIEGCKKNDRKYQEILYTSWYSIFLSIVRKYIKDSGLAEESLNNGFLKIYKNIDKYNYSGSFEGWMKKIIQREAINSLVLAKNYRKRFLYTGEIPNIGVEDIISKLSKKEIENIVEKIRGKYGLVLKHFMYGATHAEISKILKIPEGTSKWYLNESRKMAKQVIKK